MVLEQTFGEGTHRLEPLQPGKTIALMLDADYSFLDNDADKRKPELVITKVEIFNQFLQELQQRTGFNFIPIVSTQRPWSVFLGETASSRFAGLLNIRQRRFDSSHQPVAVDSMLASCEFGGVALVRKGPNGWKMQENITLAKGLGLKRNVQHLTSWFIKMGYAPEPNRNYPGKDIGDQYTGDTILEYGNVFYVALQEKNDQPMAEKKKTHLAEEIVNVLQTQEETEILKAFRISTTGRDLDFLPTVYQEQGKIIGGDLLTETIHTDYPWFSLRDTLAVDDQGHVAGRLFERILAAGGYTVAPSNADSALKQIGDKNNRAVVSKHPFFLGIIDGIHQALTGKTYPKLDQVARLIK